MPKAGSAVLTLRVSQELDRRIAREARRKRRTKSAVLREVIEGAFAGSAPAADPASRTFNVKLDLPADAGLRAGQFARLTVSVGDSRALRAPASAVTQRGQMELIFVVAEHGAQLRLVKTGKRIGDEVEIFSGLSAGEHVVVEGASQLRDGQPVEVKP